MSPSEANQVTAQTTTQREATRPPYTIADAIRDAQFYRTRPDIVVDSRKAKQVMDTLLAGLELSRCYFNAVQRGQEVFVLVQQDRAAPAAIVAWADAAAEHGCENAKVDDAYRMSGRWTNQPTEKTKWPT